MMASTIYTNAITDTRGMRSRFAQASVSVPGFHRSIVLQRHLIPSFSQRLNRKSVSRVIKPSCYITQHDTSTASQDKFTTVQPPPPLPGAFVVHGKAQYLGMEVQFSWRWRSDGAFREDIIAPYLSSSWGFDPATNTTWETDSTKCSSKLCYDDHEAAVLAASVFSGSWLYTENALNLLDITLHDSEKTSSTETGNGPVVTAEIRVKDGKLASKIELERLQDGTNLLRPLKMTQLTASNPETTTFKGWTFGEAISGSCFDGLDTTCVVVQYPEVVLRDPGTGIVNEFRAESVSVIDDVEEAENFCKMPSSPILPADAFFISGVSDAVKAWYAPSGHVLVRPTINGKTVGVFILDTGASCFVISPEAAKQLKLEGFGELHVTSMAGQVPSTFRKADTFQLGPLVMKDPVFVEMPCKGLARGTKEPVAGIIGYDVFRRAVIEMPPPLEANDAVEQQQQNGKKVVVSQGKKNETGKDNNITSPEAAIAAEMYAKKKTNAAAGNAALIEYSIHVYHPSLFEYIDGSDDGNFASNNTSSDLASSIEDSSIYNTSGGLFSLPHVAAVASTSSATNNKNSSSITTTSFLPSSSDEYNNIDGTNNDDDVLKNSWLKLHMICGLPHVEAHVQAFVIQDDTTMGEMRDESNQAALLMLDTGAGGVDIMLNNRGVQSLVTAHETATTSDDKSGSGSKVKKLTVVRGVGGDNAGSIKTERRQLHKVAIGQQTFQNVSCLCATSQLGGGGLELSLYGSGIVCGELLKRSRLVIDLPRERIAIL